MSRGMHMLRKGSRKRRDVDTKVLRRGGVRALRQGKWLEQRYTCVDRLAHSFNLTGLLIFPDTVLALCSTDDSAITPALSTWRSSWQARLENGLYSLPLALQRVTPK